MELAQELDVALTAAREAADYLIQEYEQFRRIADAPASITTHADRAAQELILAVLSRAFPADAYCAEEDTPGLASLRRDGPRMWIIDPIDGTRGFARKNGEFCVMIALCVSGRIALGVVSEPARRQTTFAVRGQGCMLRRFDGSQEPCRVSSTARLQDATLVQSHRRHRPRPTRAVQFLRPAKVLESYSAGIKLAMVARGEADLYLNTYEAFSDWDIAAGEILVTEAGGQVTDLAGRPIRYTGRPKQQTAGLLASNGLLHQAALDAWQAGN